MIFDDYENRKKKHRSLGVRIRRAYVIKFSGQERHKGHCECFYFNPGTGTCISKIMDWNGLGEGGRGDF